MAALSYIIPSTFFKCLTSNINGEPTEATTVSIWPTKVRTRRLSNPQCRSVAGFSITHADYSTKKRYDQYMFVESIWIVSLVMGIIGNVFPALSFDTCIE